MIRGLYTPIESNQTHTFFVYSSFALNDLKNMLHIAITKLTDIGLKIHSVISDMGSNFVQLSNILGVTPEKLEFEVDRQTILYIFDTPHLLKTT